MRYVRSPRAFTLTELMIAVVVLIGVLVATSKIFSTMSRVTGVGEATASLLQEIGTVERHVRQDMGTLSRDGVFAIRCVAVPNDIHAAAGNPRLLNPNLPPEAMIRCDQLVFFTNAIASTSLWTVGTFSNAKSQGTASRVYYGHAFQLEEASVAFDPSQQSPFTALDPDPAAQRMTPWYDGEVRLQNTQYEPIGQDNTFRATGSSEMANVTALDPRQWLLARQSVLLGDDDRGELWAGSKTLYIGQVVTARSIFLADPRAELGWTPQLMHGRVDAAATTLDELRRVLAYDFSGGRPAIRPWRDGGANDQYSLIADGLVYYPRSERTSPSMSRIDHVLTTNVLASACSGVRIDWTYDDRVGEVTEDNGRILWDGFHIDGSLGRYERDREVEQPWFGLADLDRGVQPLGAENTWTVGETIFADNIERWPNGWGNDVEVYEAVFGLNEDTPLAFDQLSGQLQPREDLGYTPWPSAIRITLTLHDPATRLEWGREIQFVIRLPKRDARGGS